jgi:hypothetical protein
MHNTVIVTTLYYVSTVAFRHNLSEERLLALLVARRMVYIASNWLCNHYSAPKFTLHVEYILGRACRMNA